MHHSVQLDKDKCRGCTTCIRQCPTEAIRVRFGKATILPERCIDCGQCVRACPHDAKVAVCDPIAMMSGYAHTVALPAPSLYGQFRNLPNINHVLLGLIEMGFDGVYEVARAAERMSQFAKHNQNKGPSPLISSACPTCVRLICQRFPKLIPHIAPEIAPAELAALAARAEAMRKTGLKSTEIGVFFITPCPAKVTAAHKPLGLGAPVIDGAFSMRDVYMRLLFALKRVKPDGKMLQKAGVMGVGWASSGGESAVMPPDSSIAVNGIENVISILEDIEDEKLPDLKFLEISACTQGCVGGCLTIENPFVSQMRLRQLLKTLPYSAAALPIAEEPGTPPRRDVPLEHAPVGSLGGDYKQAIENYHRAEAIKERLPGLDCASCGAPSCHAHANDVVGGYAREDDCIFYARDKSDVDTFLPPPFRKGTAELP